MRAVVTGGAGFLGSHLCEYLVRRGDQVICVDDLSSGRRENVAHLLPSPNFTFLHRDVCGGIRVPDPVDSVVHLASPASPRDYCRHPLETLAAGSHGTEQALRLARTNEARFVLASTSEVYGDPAVHPQSEDYWGNVNPVGPRSVYDEAKRYAEALTAAYRRTLRTDTGIVRIFNTYGPRMRLDDGRVITAFIAQALAGEPLTVYGDGSQTRSFCFVDDLTAGLAAMIDADEPGPVNLGNPQELSIGAVAAAVLRATGSRSSVEHRPLPAEDPSRRRPVIDRARERLHWRPQVPFEDGLRRTIEWFRSRPAELRGVASTTGGTLTPVAFCGADFGEPPEQFPTAVGSDSSPTE